MLSTILLAAAFICFGAATVNVPSRVNLVSLGLALWVLVPLIGAVK